MSCREIRAHVSEPFWYIYVMYRTPEGQQCTFSWRRGHIYDHAIATVLYENCVDESTARIAKVGPQAHAGWIFFCVIMARSPLWAHKTQAFSAHLLHVMTDCEVVSEELEKLPCGCQLMHMMSREKSAMSSFWREPGASPECMHPGPSECCPTPM